VTALRWGLLSTAKINDAILGAGVADVAAVASRTAERAEAYARSRGIPHAHGSYEALLDDPAIDAVYVSLPNSMHLPWATRALEAGKHVLCEKPLSRVAADVEAAFDVAQRRGLHLAEAFMWRHHPQVARAFELLDAGAIGRLTLVRATFLAGLAPEGDLRLTRALDGGALMDIGCYCVSAARAFTRGEPVAVEAMRAAGGDDVDVRLTGLLRFDGDVLAVIDCGFDLPDRGAVELIGSEGVITLPDPWHAFEPRVELTRDGATERFAFAPRVHYAAQLRDFEAAARGEHPALLGRDDAVGQARTIEALYAAAERDRAGV
jgi:predicted dehydrogenase